MEQIQGQPLDVDFFANHKWLGDPIYYDGPLISHYQGPDHRHWLLCWSDNDATHNRWLAGQLDLGSIGNYLRGVVYLDKTLARAHRVLVVDMPDSGKPTCIIEAPYVDIPEYLKPDPGFCYKLNLPEYFLKLSAFDRLCEKMKADPWHVKFRRWLWVKWFFASGKKFIHPIVEE